MTRTLLAMVLILGALRAAPARAEVIERVVAVVNDEPVYLSELRRRAAPFLLEVMSAKTETERQAGIGQLYRQILDLFVDQRLIAQTARKLEVSVEPVEVDRLIRNQIRISGLEESEFWATLRERGIAEVQYREDARRQLLRLKVLNVRARGRVNIREQDVREQYDTLVAQSQRSTRFRVAHIFLPIPAETTTEELAAVKARADALSDKLTPETFDATVQEVGGGDLGWIGQGELPAPLEAALTKVQTGELSKPVRGPGGLHIFYVRERQESGSQVPSYEQARMQIYNQLLSQAMDRHQEALLDELRREATISKRL